jgi:hypothetical protein
MPPTPGRRGEPKHLGQPLAVRGQHPPASPRCRGAQALELLEVTLPLNKRRLHDLHSAILGPLGAGIEASRFYRAWRTRGFADMAPGMCTTSAAQSRGHGGTSSSTAKAAGQQGCPAATGLESSPHIPTTDVFSGRQMPYRTRQRPAFPLVSAYVEPPAGIEPATPSLPWNHQEPLCGPPFPQVTPDRRGRSYRFSFGEVMRSSFSRRPRGL